MDVRYGAATFNFHCTCRSAEQSSGFSVLYPIYTICGSQKTDRFKQFRRNRLSPSFQSSVERPRLLLVLDASHQQKCKKYL